MVKTRHEGLDALKCICAFLVVTIHSPMIPGITGELITALNRMAVPVFFMITGWFYEGVVTRGRKKPQLIRVIKLILWSSLFYFLFNGIIAAVQGELSSYIRSYLSVKVLVKFLVFTASPFQSHLWYLSALLYVLLIVGWFEARFDRKKLYWMIPVLLLGDLVFGKYSLLIWGRAFPTSMVRNWLFVGLPYFLLGDCLNNNRDKISGFLSHKRIWFYILIAVFAATTILENHILVSLDLNAERNHYISSTFLSVTAFLLALKQDGKAKGVSGWLARVGKRHSTMIYIIHPAFLTLFSLLINTAFADPEPVMSIYRWTAAILAFAASLGYSALHEKLKEKTSNNK